MFRITENPSSGSLVQCLAKNYKNDSIVSVSLDKVGVMAAYCDQLCVCLVQRIGRHGLLGLSRGLNLDQLYRPFDCTRPTKSLILLTYLLTPWCRVLPEHLTGLQLVKKFPAFHGTRRFITALTSVATCFYPGPAQCSPYTHIPPPGDPA